MSKEAMKMALELFEQFGRDSRLKYEHQAIYKTIVALKEALAKQEHGEPVAWIPYLSDRADGVKGHYAIARWNPRGYREVWNLRRHKWGAYSDDVMSLEEADTLLRLITIPTQKITPQPKQEHCEPWNHGGRPMTLRECMEAEEPQQGHSFTYDQMKEHAEGMQRDYDLLLAEYNLLKQEQGEPFGYWFSDDPAVVAYAGSGFFKGSKPPNDAVNIIPLYTTPPQQRKPLTDRQINAIWDSLITSPDYSREMIVRAIESAHGIKGDA